MLTKDHYKWLETQLRLQAAKMLRAADPSDDDGKPLCLVTVTARGGTFESPPTRSANDLTAMRMLLLFILLLIYANSRAKLCEVVSFSREIRGGEIWWAIPVTAALLLGQRVLAFLLSRCQNDHLPTRAGGALSLIHI